MGAVEYQLLKNEITNLKAHLYDEDPRMKPAPPTPSEKLEPGVRFTRFARCIANGKGKEASFASREYPDDQGLARALSAGSSAAGGFLVAGDLAEDTIEALRPLAVVRSLNPVEWPLVRGSLDIPKISSPVTASYGQENVAFTVSQPGTAQIKLVGKKAIIEVPVSTQLLQYSDGRAERAVRAELLQALASIEDYSFLVGTGEQGTPRGLLNWCNSSNAIAANSSVSAANTILDLKKVPAALRAAGVRFLRPGWIISPRTEAYLLNLTSGAGADTVFTFLFREEMNAGRIGPYPYKCSALIPETLGVSANASVVLFADFADVIIGDVPNLRVDASIQAAYKDGAGNLISAMSSDLTIFRLIAEHDIAMRHQESVAALTGVIWS